MGDGAPLIDHITFGVSDMDRAIAFYDRALAPLGIRRLYGGHDGVVRVSSYGVERPQFWLAEQDATRGKLHVAFTAADMSAVDAFHAAALAAGGTDNGPPGLRPHYHPGYYGAFALDPDGHNIEAVCHRGQAAG